MPLDQFLALIGEPIPRRGHLHELFALRPYHA
jgi:hypothetical protein